MAGKGSRFIGKRFNETERKDLSKERGNRDRLKAPDREYIKLVQSSSPYCKEYKLHPNSLANMKPSSKWTVLIDETGQFDDERAFIDEGTAGKDAYQKGVRVVALFIPQETNLPLLEKGWHANQLNYDEIEQAVDTVLKSRCGVLGVHVNTLEYINDEHWLPAIASVLELGLRLIPKSGRTEFEVLAEQRGEFNASSDVLWSYISKAVKTRYAQAYPGQSEHLAITGRFIKKEDDRRNGYVDALAFLWGSNLTDLRKKSGLLGSCFYSSSRQTLRTSYDRMQKEGYVDPAEWTSLLDADPPNPKAQNYDALPLAILRNLGQRAQAEPRIWEKFSNYVSEHVNSKDVRLETLDRQIGWLEAFEPFAPPASPRARLRFLTSKLALNNHHGETLEKFKREEEFRELAKKLYYEDAPFVCDALITLAVAHTNAFEFEKIDELFKGKWEPEIIAKSPEIPGLKLCGRFLSTCGQAQAFIGENGKAASCFKDAIKQFRRLSDSAESALEISQTLCYRMIALMDAKENDAFEECVDEYFRLNLPAGVQIPEGETLTLPRVAEILRGADDNRSKYAHALLLRYLAVSKTKAAQKAKEIYFANPNEWQNGANHPWELIEFYRAVLGPKEAAVGRLELARKAIENDRGSDGTLGLIDSVILGAMLCYSGQDSDLSQEYLDRTVETRKNFSRIGEERLRILDEQRDPLKRREPLDFAKLILPFNFR